MGRCRGEVACQSPPETSRQGSENGLASVCGLTRVCSRPVRWAAHPRRLFLVPLALTCANSARSCTLRTGEERLTDRGRLWVWRLRSPRPSCVKVPAWTEGSKERTWDP